MWKNKTVATIAMLLILTFAISFFAMSTANAHSPPWTIISFPYIVPAPNPIGVGQTVSIVMWIDTPLVSSAVTNDIRRHDYTLTITAPDNSVETKHWDVVEDTTSIQYYRYTPTQVGTYTLKFDYGGQTYTWNVPGVTPANNYTGDTFTAASKTTTLTVQEEPIRAARDSYPLPTEYWTRPIEGQNTYWYAVSSNWLGQPFISGAGAAYGIPGNIQPEGTAPNSPHIMWSKPIQYGGVVGGGSVGVPGNTFYTGGSYNVRYSNPLVIYGTLYYQEPYGNSGGGGDYVAVDLRTGEELWRTNTTGIGVPSFGYLYDYESPNQHGILPNGLLIAASGFGVQTWRTYDPKTGIPTTMNLTNVPAGPAVGGPQGEILRYTLTNVGNATNPNWYLAQWNSSRVFGGGAGLSPSNWYSGNIPGNVPFNYTSLGSNTYWNGSMWVSNAVRTAQGYAAVQWTSPSYDWNISLPSLGIGSWSVGTANLGIIPLVSLDNMLLLTQGTFGGHPGDFSAVPTTDDANITAVNLNVTKGARGNIMWTERYPQAPNNNTRFLECWDTDAGVFIFWDKEDKVIYGYSLANGDRLWGPTEPANDWMFLPNSVMTAYGKAYWTGYGGITYCYDVRNGSLLWTYGNGGPGNSTDSGLDTPWGRYPTFVDVIADGKIYLSTTEHSPNTPLYKDSLVRCLNATDGTEIWTLMGYATQMYGGTDLVADGFFAFLNCYDMQIYCVGRGPSATTVAASPKVSVHGSSVLVEGTVIDIAAGTKQKEQAARFPYGVPAVSDESMGRWMEYVYMQKPRPTDTVGVEVILSVLDPNNNVYDIGTATTDSSGTFSLLWEPLVPGKYTVIARFAGSEGYWPSYAETAVGIEEAPEATPAPTPTPAPMTDTYVTGFGIGIIIAIVAVGIVLVIVLRRR